MTDKYENVKRYGHLKYGFGFEKILSTAFILLFICLLASQTLLFIPKLRNIILSDENREGTPVAREEFLYKSGTIVLRLIGLDNCTSLKVLVNGEEKGQFAGNSFLLDLVKGDLVEIDASQMVESIELEITSIHGIIPADYLGKRYHIDQKVQKLFTV